MMPAPPSGSAARPERAACAADFAVASGFDDGCDVGFDDGCDFADDFDVRFGCEAGCAAARPAGESNSLASDDAPAPRRKSGTRTAANAITATTAMTTISINVPHAE
jgi:hypothetical protein